MKRKPKFTSLPALVRRYPYLNLQNIISCRMYDHVHGHHDVSIAPGPRIHAARVVSDALGFRNNDGYTVLKRSRKFSHWSFSRISFCLKGGGRRPDVVAHYCPGQDYDAELRSIRRDIRAML